MTRKKERTLNLRTVPYSKMKKTAFIFFTLIGFIMVFILSAEVFVRMKGMKPYKITRPEIAIEPGGMFYMKNDLLGYTHIPGKFKITIKENFSFSVTNNENSYRVTQPIDQQEFYREKDEIWIMGCSYTYGWALNDEDTFPWLIQKKIPGYKINNYGVCGYGSIHSLIQIKELLKERNIPKIIIVTYATFHDLRNTFSRIRRRAVSRWNFLGPLTQPYASLDKNGHLKLHRADEVIYKPWPFTRMLALVYYLENKYNNHEVRVAQPFQVSQAIFLEISKICREKGIKLIVAGIKENNQKKMRRMLDFCEKSGLSTVDISVDVENEKYSHLPLDAHPNELANLLYAEKLYSYLRKEGLI